MTAAIKHCSVRSLSHCGKYVICRMLSTSSNINNNNCMGKKRETSIRCIQIKCRCMCVASQLAKHRSDIKLILNNIQLNRIDWVNLCAHLIGATSSSIHTRYLIHKSIHAHTLSNTFISNPKKKTSTKIANTQKSLIWHLLNTHTHTHWIWNFSFCCVILITQSHITSTCEKKRDLIDLSNDEWNEIGNARCITWIVGSLPRCIEFTHALMSKASHCICLCDFFQRSTQ